MSDETAAKLTPPIQPVPGPPVAAGVPQPVQNALVQNTPIQNTPIQNTPVQNTPVQGTGAAAGKPAAQAAPSRKKSKRRFLLPVLLLALVGGAYAGYEYLTDWQFHISTDDAYVKADMSIIAAKVSGYVATVSVAENTGVKAGDVLAIIDPGDYALAVRAAKDRIATQDSTIARMRQQADAQKAVIAQTEAQLLSANADALRASLAFDRAVTLARNDYTSKATLDQARADKDRTAAGVVSAKATIQSAKAQLSVLTAQTEEQEHKQDELRTALAQTERDLSFTSIKAPFDGVVGNKAVEAGQYVTAGTRLLALVPLQNVYVEANFKETQLAHLAKGQKVDVRVDAYSDRTVTGTVESVSPASGSEFSMLPPENATGNFTKIVQRIPVRIHIPESVTREGILRPGMSVVADVNTHDDATPKPTLLGLLGLDKLNLGWLGLGTSAKAEPLAARAETAGR